MNAAMRAVLTGLLLSMAAGAAQAKPPRVALLPEGVCNDDDNGNDQILLRGKHVAGRCLMQALPGELREDGSSKPPDKARIVLDGELLSVILTSSSTMPAKPDRAGMHAVGTQEKFVYASADRRVRVSIQARVTTSDCAINTDSGCSDTYEGQMTVERGGERSVIAIDYYRGT